jgi:Cu/Ag efflux protein CusF
MKQVAGWLVGSMAIVASGCTSASSNAAAGGRYAITGTIAATRDAATVTLAHDAIDGYMPAMTMDFRADALPPVRAGDRVRATLVVTSESSRLDDVVVLAAGGAASPAAVLTGPTAPGGIVPDATRATS